MDTKLIGARIAKARKALHLSQAQMAQRLFISPQAVGKWERGESMPDITTFTRLAEMLGVDLNYFSATTPAVANEVLRDESPVKETVSVPEPLKHSPERPVQIDLTAIGLQGSDFAGVVLHKGKFKSSQLRGADFTGADLTGSSFEVIDAIDANFDGANLTDCNFSVTDLANASFRKSILVRTILRTSGQGARFSDVNMVDVRISKTDLSNTIFRNCIFNNVDFRYCDLHGLCFDGMTFAGVKFDKSILNDVSFRGATLRNVSFTLPFSVTNKSYRAMKTVCFDGATMDKLTYVALKGIGTIDLSKVTVI
jgi:uncharacterized protein YjbI with pentapeptide repeats